MMAEPERGEQSEDGVEGCRVSSQAVDKIIEVLVCLSHRQQTISQSQLIHTYGSLHNEELSPQALGFPNLSRLVAHLAEQGKCRVTPVSPGPGQGQEFLILTSKYEQDQALAWQVKNNIALHQKERRATNDAVSIADVPKQAEKPSTVGHCFLAEITQVVSVEEVWLCDVENIRERNRLMRELRSFYKKSEVKYRYQVLEKCHCHTGRMMAAKYYDQGMHRVVVKKFVSEDEILVQYIDYGTSHTIPWRDLYFLSRKFLAWPVLAVEVGFVEMLTSDLRSLL